MINHWILSKSNTTSTSEAGTATLPEQLSLSSSSGVRATQYLVFCVIFVSTSFCRVVFFLLILLYIRLRITAFDYFYGIFKPFLFRICTL